MRANDPGDDGLPALLYPTYAATTDPSRDDEPVSVRERYWQQLDPSELAKDHVACV